MQPAGPTRSRRGIGIFGLVLAVVALAGCSALPFAVPGSQPLVTVQLRGGLCAAGPCDRSITLQRDGVVREGAKPPNELGRVSADALAALDVAIRTADYPRLRSRPFTGQCPVNVDGQELVFEFDAPGGTQRLASCEVDIDWGSQLLVALAAALGEFIPMPTT